jgi:hypothetical protein
MYKNYLFHIIGRLLWNLLPSKFPNCELVFLSTKIVNLLAQSVGSIPHSCLHVQLRRYAVLWTPCNIPGRIIRPRRSPFAISHLVFSSKHQYTVRRLRRGMRRWYSSSSLRTMWPRTKAEWGLELRMLKELHLYTSLWKWNQRVSVGCVPRVYANF